MLARLSLSTYHLILLLIFLMPDAATAQASNALGAIPADELPDRQQQVPFLVPGSDNAQSGDHGNARNPLNLAAQEIVNEQKGHQDQSDVDRRPNKTKDKHRGVVFANSHNDEMQKHPFVSLMIVCLVRDKTIG